MGIKTKKYNGGSRNSIISNKDENSYIYLSGRNGHKISLKYLNSINGLSREIISILVNDEILVDNNGNVLTTENGLPIPVYTYGENENKRVLLKTDIYKKLVELYKQGKIGIRKEISFMNNEKHNKQIRQSVKKIGNSMTSGIRHDINRILSFMKKRFKFLLDDSDYYVYKQVQISRGRIDNDKIFKEEFNELVKKQDIEIIKHLENVEKSKKQEEGRLTLTSGKYNNAKKAFIESANASEFKHIKKIFKDNNENNKKTSKNNLSNNTNNNNNTKLSPAEKIELTIAGNKFSNLVGLEDDSSHSVIGPFTDAFAIGTSHVGAPGSLQAAQLTSAAIYGTKSYLKSKAEKDKQLRQNLKSIEKVYDNYDKISDEDKEIIKNVLNGYLQSQEYQNYLDMRYVNNIPEENIKKLGLLGKCAYGICETIKRGSMRVSQGIRYLSRKTNKSKKPIETILV
jgi:hypothetical protein